MTRLKGWAWGGGLTTAIFWLTVSVGLLGMATAYGFHLLQVERQHGCEARNESTRDSAQVVVKALVKASDPSTPDPRIGAFLNDIDEGLAEVQVDC